MGAFHNWPVVSKKLQEQERERMRMSCCTIKDTEETIKETAMYNPGLNPGLLGSEEWQAGGRRRKMVLVVV